MQGKVCGVSSGTVICGQSGVMARLELVELVGEAIVGTKTECLTWPCFSPFTYILSPLMRIEGLS